MKPLLVGEDNPYQIDPERAQRYALYPEPEHSAGGRLCRLILGLSIEDYIRGFDRANLCSGKWSAKEARESAARIRREVVQVVAGGVGLQSRTVVLLGAKASSAFGFISFEPFRHVDVSGFRFVILPHPSGRNQIWNEPWVIGRARETLTLAGVLPLRERPMPTKDLSSTDCTTVRPARCSNCGARVVTESCQDCGPRQ